MRSIAVVNLKGGSGKTTTALSLALGAALRDLRVLLIDADPHSNATMTMLDGQPAADPTLGHVLLDQVVAAEAIRPTRRSCWRDQLGRERRLRTAMLAVEHEYDLVILDAAPQLNLVGINLLNYARELLIPVDAGLYSVAGLGRLQETVDQVQRYLDNRELRISGLVLTRAHNNRATKDIEAQLRAAFGSLVHEAVISHSVRVEEAHSRHRTVLEFAPPSTPALAYDRLITEVLGHGEFTGNPDLGGNADQADYDADAA
jgi:chromosome partitioning protein